MSDSEELTDDDHGYVTRQRFSFFASVSSAASEGVQVDLVTFYQPRVDDPGDVRAFTAASVEVDITGGLYVLLRYDLVHDSHPPSGVRKTDQTLRSGFGFKL